MRELTQSELQAVSGGLFLAGTGISLTAGTGLVARLVSPPVAPGGIKNLLGSLGLAKGTQNTQLLLHLGPPVTSTP